MSSNITEIESNIQAAVKVVNVANKAVKVAGDKRSAAKMRIIAGCSGWEIAKGYPSNKKDKKVVALNEEFDAMSGLQPSVSKTVRQISSRIRKDERTAPIASDPKELLAFFETVVIDESNVGIQNQQQLRVWLGMVTKLSFTQELANLCKRHGFDDAGKASKAMVKSASTKVFIDTITVT